MTIASEDLNTPTGITKNNDGIEIYVADSKEYAIGVYKRNTTTNELTLVEIFNPNHKLDNIKFDNETNSIHGGAIV